MKFLILALPVLLAAASPADDVYDKTWTSNHWASGGIYGEAPRRVVVLVDRESVQPGPTANTREFNVASLIEGMEAGSGIVMRLRVDCTAKSHVALGSVEYFDGNRDVVPPDDTTAYPFDPKAANYPTMLAVCSGNWTGMQLIDAPDHEARVQVFGN